MITETGRYLTLQKIVDNYTWSVELIHNNNVVYKAPQISLLYQHGVPYINISYEILREDNLRGLFTIKIKAKDLNNKTSDVSVLNAILKHVDINTRINHRIYLLEK